MDDILDDIVRVARRCERAARAFETEPLARMFGRLHAAIDEVARAWSGSWLGYHASVYIQGLRPRRPGEHFDSEWGAKGPSFCNQTTGPWCEYAYEAVAEEIQRRAEVPELTPIADAARAARDVFEQSKNELLPTLDAVLTTHDDAVLRDLTKARRVEKVSHS